MEWLKVNEAAERLGVSSRTANERVRRAHESGDPRVRWSSGRGGQFRELHTTLLAEWLGEPARDADLNYLEIENRALAAEVAQLQIATSERELSDLRAENRRLKIALQALTSIDASP